MATYDRDDLDPYLMGREHDSEDPGENPEQEIHIEVVGTIRPLSTEDLQQILDTSRGNLAAFMERLDERGA